MNLERSRGPYRKVDPIARFWSKTRVEGPCLVWTAARDDKGYGSFGISTPRRKVVRSHRWIYERLFGKTPAGRVVRHSCDNPACVKPQHLEVGTQIQNMQECADRGRLKIGRRVESTMKLTDEDVASIRTSLASGISQSEIARRYKVRPQTINGIATGRRRR